MLRLARGLFYRRPFGLYPRRLQQEDWKCRSLSSYVRESIWSFFHHRNRTVPLVVPWHRDLRIGLNLGNELSRSVFVEGIYEPNEFVWMTNFLQPGMVVIDIGAHEGMYTLFASRCVEGGGHIWSIEPSSRERGYLRRNVRRNLLENVTILDVAVGASDGQAMLQLADDVRSGRNTITGAVAIHSQGIRSENVDVRSLDHLAVIHQWIRIDLIKIDTEGAELDILRGAREVITRFRPAIMLEVPQGRPTQQGRCLGELLEAFRLHDYGVFGFDPEAGLPTSAPAAGDLNLVAIPRE